MTPRNAILLLRISDDKANDEHGVLLQEKNGRAHANKIGWAIGRVIIENDTSAFKRKRIRLPNGRMELRTVRPGFREALDLLANRVNDGLLAIDLDRACRDPRDLEDMIDVVESSHPRLPVDSVTGSLRLANDADITMARVMVAIANKASRDTRRRIADRQQEMALQGKPTGGGWRAYGYERDGITLVEHETTVIRWMAERIMPTRDEEGWSLGRIAKDLTDRRIPTASGLAHWSGRTVSGILQSPRIAGLRVYKGRIVAQAVWKPILTRPEWEAVCAELSGRENRVVDTRLKRWLSAVLVCGLCDARLTGSHVRAGAGGSRYWCHTSRGGCGKIAIAAQAAEAEIESQVLEYIQDPRVMSRLRAAQDTLDAQQVRAEIAEDEEQLKELAREWAHKRMNLAEYREARAIIDERVEANRALLSVSAPKAVQVLTRSSDPVAEWARFAPAWRRDVVLGLVAGYRVLPHPKDKARRFDPDRLVPIPHKRG